MKRIVGAFALGLLVTGGAHAKNLTGEQLQEALVGKTIMFGKTSTKNTAYYSSDGSAKVTLDGKDDTGSWRISGSKMCAKWTKIRAGKENCFTVESTGDNTYKTSTGLTLKTK